MNTQMKTQTSLSFWWVVLAAASLIGFTMGIRHFFGLYMPAYGEINNSGREIFGLAIAMQNLIWGMLAPVFGVVADRYGCGKVAIYASFIYVTGLLLMFFTTPVGLFGGQFLIGVGVAGCGFSVALGAIGKAVPLEKRSFALGLATAGGSFGQFALVPISSGITASLGWALGFAALAGLAVAILFPFAGIMKQFDVPNVGKKDERKFTDVFGEALKNYDYILLTFGFLVCGLQVVFIAVHLPGYLADFNLSPSLASWSLALIGLFNIIGSIACGWIGGRYSKKDSLTILYTLRSLAFLAFIAFPPTPVGTLIFSAVLGLLWLGTVPLTSGLVVHFFGPTNMALLYGFVFFSHQVGSFFGAWLGGFLYDFSGNYDTMWAIVIISGFVAAALHYPIKESSYAPATA